MANKKTGMKGSKESFGSGLGGALLSIVAFGFAFGAALIGGAMALGEALEDKQASDQEKLEERRAADREEVRRISAVESGTDCDIYE